MQEDSVGPKIRADLTTIPAYKPGRNPEDVARERGFSAAIKLASNETPYGPLPGVAEAITQAGNSINRYPDMFATQLQTSLALYHGVEPSQVVSGCGSVALCELLAQVFALPGDEVIFGWRSFEAYPIIAQRIGARPVQVPNTDDHRIDIAGIAAAVTHRTRLIFLCTPNNPTGTVLSGEELRWLLAEVRDDVVVAIDEAYYDFIIDSSHTSGLELLAHENVAVLRTFSKAWSLAGARCGYLISSNVIAEGVRKIVTPFSNSAPAQAGALAALQQEDEMRRKVSLIIGERERVIKEMRAFSIGLSIPDSEANFFWLPLGTQSSAFAAGCEERGVIVRAFPNEGVRVTVGTHEENTMFLIAAAELFN
jgi:histidinol-phosphate aminotransferase